MALATIRVGPPEIRDPQKRSRTDVVERVRFTGMTWAAPGRILYIQALSEGDPQGLSIEMEVRQAYLFYKMLEARLREAGLVL